MKKIIFSVVAMLAFTFISYGKMAEDTGSGGCLSTGCVNKPDKNNGTCKTVTSDVSTCYVCVDRKWYQSNDCVKGG